MLLVEYKVIVDSPLALLDLQVGVGQSAERCANVYGPESAEEKHRDRQHAAQSLGRWLA
jgi:hypothetical protein